LLGRANVGKGSMGCLSSRADQIQGFGRIVGVEAHRFLLEFAIGDVLGRPLAQ
jgi:hypothetical protein